ncbi:MAG: sigma-54 dependent transcriptional regulator, acetoin dehydrogenase operon transcriptional [Frankiaceae bacterium]|nr:sigma-54 dependent transcriptional regulator, acetoin dehydrogenase operon transcriptional [Frankiaceae bacterium]
MSVPLRAVYRAREEFFADGEVGEQLAVKVRPEVLTSWRRSRMSGASPLAPTLHYEDDVITDSPLCIAAEPVLAKLADRFSGLRAGVLLSDRNARIIRRWVAPDSGILLQMERISSIVGASGSEQFIGTNGIGTVAEDRRARMIVGPEHYAEALSTFTCVGAPIHNPLTHKLEGIVTLNSDVDSASPLLTPLITSTAQEIEHRLLDQASLRERMLLDTFLTANRAGGSVAVVGEDVFMAGPRAARLLEGLDQALIWQFATEAVATRRAGRGSRAIFIPTGNSVAALRCSPLMVDGRLAGALLEVDEGADVAVAIAMSSRAPAARPHVTGAAPRLRPAESDGWPEAQQLLPGRSPAWQSTLRAAAVHRLSDLPIAVVGEAGTGKLSLLKAMFAPAAGDDPLHVIDCTTAGEGGAEWLARMRVDLTQRSGVVVLRHLDALDDDTAVGLSAQVDELVGRPSAPHLVATADAVEAWASKPAQRRLLDQVGVARLEVPALRERREDIKDLVAQIITRHAGDRTPRLSHGALVAMTRAQWPGNIRQLESVVRGIIASAGLREVTVEMLPAWLGQYSSRRELTQMEQVELDAIMSAIQRSEGNKVLAAKLLGISRSTLYRKMRSYKLDPDKHFF